MYAETSEDPSTVFDSRQYGSPGCRRPRRPRVHLSGQVAVDAYERTVGDDFAIQLPVVFDNIERVLDATGGALIHVVALRIYLVESVRDQQQEGADAMRSRFPSTRRRGVVAA